LKQIKETGTSTEYISNIGSQTQEAFEMWMEEISWFDKVTNMEVPRRVNKY